MPPRTAGELLAACLALGITTAESVVDLNEFLRAHRKLIDQVHETAPRLWDALRTQTITRRQKLAEQERSHAAP